MKTKSGYISDENGIVRTDFYRTDIISLSWASDNIFLTNQLEEIDGKLITLKINLIRERFVMVLQSQPKQH